ncbi:hypothetical protein COT47_02380 [Candidatus Woesearchaeota archaeon CG08_land_8_20_14_0_20_43_7]|nr:MAG: hypothetical protein COT47_02380 [Candidatus Woesearchaeota archaeon CG08_land_8_20_14_0_20_43_7]
MYKANLSHKMLDEYLTELINGDFIEEHISTRGKTYSLKSKGYGFLEKYKVILEFTESFGLS